MLSLIQPEPQFVLRQAITVDLQHQPAFPVDQSYIGVDYPSTRNQKHLKQTQADYFWGGGGNLPHGIGST